MSTEKLVATTKYGKVMGLEKNGTVLFKGIRYAKAPRFLPPEEPDEIDGIYEATKFGQVSYQLPDELAGLLSGPAPDTSEDCLFLNVQTPSLDGSKRPVMVWIHGGAFIGGSGSTPWYKGEYLVKRGNVVVVTINYRLGALGFLNLKDFLGDDYASSGITGILDQIAALKWVNENIENFGGDPNNVTIFGESAGAMSVGTLLGMQTARQYFNKAILQSGSSFNIITQEHSNIVTETFIRLTGAGDATGLLSLDPSTFLEAQKNLGPELLSHHISSNPSGLNLAGLPFQPVIDGIHLKEAPIEAVRRGDASQISIIVGSNENEWNLFALMMPSPDSFEKIENRLNRLSPDSVKVLEAYRSSRPDSSPGEIWNAILTDYVFFIPALRLLEAQSRYNNNCYQYKFTWKSTAFAGVLGSCHALEIPFVFGSLDDQGAQFMTGTNPPQSLSDIMQDYWIHFAKNGSLTSMDSQNENWEPFNASEAKYMEFGDHSGMRSVESYEEIACWEGIR